MAAHDTLVAVVVLPDESAGGLADILVAELAEIGFEGFVPSDRILTAYGPAAELDSEKHRIAALLLRYGCSLGAMRRVERENWNAPWESSFTSISAGPFTVHPPWETPSGETTAICIEPKMSFGTGHHETTQMMLGFVADLVRPGDTVMDAGTGTGVLAIAAVLLGARHVDAFDVDSWSIRNAIENGDRNGVGEQIHVVEGSLETVPMAIYDTILANINRNVLVQMMPGFAERLRPGGRLALAGMLREERSMIVDALSQSGFHPDKEQAYGDWWAIAAVRL